MSFITLFRKGDTYDPLAVPQRTDHVQYRELHALFFANSAWVVLLSRVKDGAYYCYCAYVLRNVRYSDFLSAVLINTGIFLRGSKLWGESRT